MDKPGKRSICQTAEGAREAPNLALEFLRWVSQQAAAFPAEGAFAPRLRPGQVHGH